MKHLLQLTAAIAAYALAGFRVVQTELNMDLLTFGLFAAASLLVTFLVTSTNKAPAIAFGTYVMVAVSALGFVLSVLPSMLAVVGLFAVLMGASVDVQALLFVATSLALIVPAIVAVKDGFA